MEFEIAMTKNDSSTRYYSDKHEKSVCRALDARQQPNSGAGLWRKGDVVQEDASLLIECKCSMKPKSSVSIKEEWFIKNKKEAFFNRFENTAICINFKPDGANYYVIDEKLMAVLCEKLKEY